MMCWLRQHEVKSRTYNTLSNARALKVKICWYLLKYMSEHCIPWTEERILRGVIINSNLDHTMTCYLHHCTKSFFIGNVSAPCNIDWLSIVLRTLPLVHILILWSQRTPDILFVQFLHPACILYATFVSRFLHLWLLLSWGTYTILFNLLRKTSLIIGDHYWYILWILNMRNWN